MQRNLEICLIGSRPHVDINSFRLDRLQAGSSYHHQPTTVNSNRHICKELCIEQGSVENLATRNNDTQSMCVQDGSPKDSDTSIYMAEDNS